MNITDVDDKTIKASSEKGISLDEYTKKYKKAFFEDLKILNIEKAEFYPEATKHINEMVSLVKKLLSKKYAYKAKDGIYYKISSFKDYGKLGHMDIKELKTGIRVKKDEYKIKAHDFALWKSWDKEDGDVFWQTELGKGRPGWHIECSAMSTKYLGESFDIHTGGVDLIFPHHENEIAQSEGATGKKFVRYWLHNEWLLVNGKKMSKSLGNFYTLRDLLNKGYDARSIRYLLLATHYRQQLNFTEESLRAAENTIQRFDDFILRLKDIKGKKSNKKLGLLISKTKKLFEKEMDDDLNISNALAVIFDFMRDVNKLVISKEDAKKVYDLMFKFDKVLGILEEKEEKISKDIKKLVEEREKARKNKDYKKADKIRNELRKKGFIVEDTKEGARLKRI